MDVPMLDEHEWEQIAPLLRNWTKDKGQAARMRYEQLTGFDEPNPVAIWHHRLGLLGPLCNVCGKPLRTRQAKLCASCGSLHPFMPERGVEY